MRQAKPLKDGNKSLSNKKRPFTLLKLTIEDRRLKEIMD